MSLNYHKGKNASQIKRTRKVRIIEQIFRGNVMVHEIEGIRKKGKPRGKPFKKREQSINAKHENGDRKGMHENNVLADSRHTTSTERENIDSETSKVEELIDQIEFRDEIGNNIKIRFIRLHNRVFKTQLILNDAVELKPATYSGSSIGKNYWGLLKSIIKSK